MYQVKSCMKQNWSKFLVWAEPKPWSESNSGDCTFMKVKVDLSAWLFWIINANTKSKHLNILNAFQSLKTTLSSRGSASELESKASLKLVRRPTNWVIYRLHLNQTPDGDDSPCYFQVQPSRVHFKSQPPRPHSLWNQGDTYSGIVAFIYSNQLFYSVQIFQPLSILNSPSSVHLSIYLLIVEHFSTCC